MFTVTTESVIQWVVDNNLDRSSDKIIYNEDGSITRPGLFIQFPVEVSFWKGEDDDGFWDHERVEITMVFCGNTSVWYNESSGITTKMNWSEFENTSNHDSCWKSDGFSKLSQLYFDMCYDIAPDSVPNDVDSTSSWVVFTKFKKCMVTHKHIGGDNYRRKLLDVKFE